MAGKGGKREGSGRKSKAEELGLQGLIEKAWPTRRRSRLFLQLALQAEEGSLEATKLLLAYTFGKPREHHEISGGLKITVTDDSSDG